MRTFNRVFPVRAFKTHWDEMKAVMLEIQDQNKQIHVLIEPEKRRRSTGYKSQNHHLNGHIQQIAMSTGQPFEDIKKYVKQMQAILQQRIDDIKAGKRQPMTRMGNMKLSRPTDDLLQMIINALDGKMPERDR